MNIFGTDGIRGKCYSELTEDILKRIGAVLNETNKEIVIASDTRETKDNIIKLMVSHIDLVKHRVSYAGIIPTASLINYSKKRKCIGVMITASHNDYRYNGIKIFIDGVKMSENLEKKFSKRIKKVILVQYKTNFTLPLNTSPLSNYLALFKNKIKTNLKIVLDLANGASINTAPLIFKKFTDNLIVINNEPNGININDNCGSLHLEGLIDTVIKNNYDYGFAFDGDADRVIAVDRAGKIYDGDMIIYVLSTYFNEKAHLPYATIVLTEMSNEGIICALKDKGINSLISKVGDKYVYSLMKDKNLSIGGEKSGHVIIRDYLDSGDGVLTAIVLLKILIEKQKSLSELTKDVVLYEEFLTNIYSENKVRETRLLKKRLRKSKKDINVLIRPSGTEDYIRLRVSAKTQEELDLKIKELKELGIIN